MKRPATIAVIIIVLLAVWFIFAPPRFWLNVTKSVDLIDPVATGMQVIEKYECRQCHQIDGAGALKAPNLAGITTHRDDATLRRWLSNPKSVNSNTAMPNFHLSDSEMTAILAYLHSLDAQQQ